MIFRNLSMADKSFAEKGDVDIEDELTGLSARTVILNKYCRSVKVDHGKFCRNCVEVSWVISFLPAQIKTSATSLFATAG